MPTKNPFLTAQHPIVLTGMEDGEAMYRYYKDHRGFDSAVKGAWQENYAAMIDAVFSLRGRRVLDLGAAMGALTFSMQERGADVWGIEINRYFVQHSPFHEIRGRLMLGDVIDILGIFRDAAFDLIHASQVLEHIAPDRQPRVIEECARVLQPDGLLFAALPMGVGPDHGVTDGDDSTHVCIKPREWWDRVRGDEFVDAPAVYEASLREQAMYIAYKWDHFIWQRRS